MAPENPALHALLVFPRFRLSEADFHWKQAKGAAWSKLKQPLHQEEEFGELETSQLG